MIVILTALEEEHAEIRAHLIGVERRSHPRGTRFAVGTVRGAGDCRVALATTDKGNTSCAILTERAIAYFDPKLVLFVGVAGALQEGIELGDVVMSTRVYAYHGGRSESAGFLAHPRAWDTPHEVEQVARDLYRERTWLKGLPEPEPSVHFAPIAAGEVVLNSINSSIAKQIRQNYNDSAAVEMESAGMAHASRLNRALPMATVRGISDLADGNKDTADREGRKIVAARNAAAFAIALTIELDKVLPEPHPPSDPGDPGEVVAPPEEVVVVNHNNIAKDNARVTNQIGVLNGDLRQAAPETGLQRLRERLKGLSETVVEAHRRGDLDNTTLTTALAALQDGMIRLGTTDLAGFDTALRGLNDTLAAAPESLRTEVTVLRISAGVLR
jgi:nucleoside phosphorylase